MKVSLNDIKEAIDCLIQETKSREELDSWALKLCLLHDDGKLQFDPPNEHDRIWDGIMYLLGVDALNTDGNYLFVLEDFIFYKKENLSHIKQKISIDIIREVFDCLIERSRSREELANWATGLQEAKNKGEVELDPPYEYDKVWNAITYLMGVNFSDKDGNFLYSVNDFIAYRKENLLQKEGEFQPPKKRKWSIIDRLLS